MPVSLEITISTADLLLPREPELLLTKKQTKERAGYHEEFSAGTLDMPRNITAVRSVTYHTPTESKITLQWNGTPNKPH